MTKWINVNNHLPAHMQHVLVCNDKGMQCVCIYVDNAKMNENLLKHGIIGEMKKGGDFCHQDKDGRILNHVTHWMPLPEPPND